MKQKLFAIALTLFTLVVVTVVSTVTAQTLGQRGVVTGILRTSTGLPLEEIRIAVTPVDQSISPGAFEALTDSTGHYRLERIPPGRYYILVGMNGRRFYFPGVTDQRNATAVEVNAGGTLEVPDTVVPGGPVTGRIVASGMGRRVENLVLCCDYFKQIQFSQRGLKQGSPLLPTISEDGSFVFPFVPTGNYALSLKDKNVIPVSWALAVGSNGVTGLQLNVTEGVEVQGTVLDLNGKPVSADIRLVPRPAKSVFTNAIDSPTNAGARPNLVENGTPQGIRPFLRAILVPKADPTLDDIQNLILEAARDQERSLIPDRLATPEPDGKFAIQNVFPGTYRLEVNAGGVVLPGREIQVGTSGLTNFSVQVPATQVSGRVVASGGGALPKLSYIRLVRGGSDSDVFYGFPNREGRFTLVLTSGSYRIFTETLGHPVQSVSDGTRDITNAEFTLEDGRNPQIIVTLAP